MPRTLCSALAILILLQPTILFAQLTSENFVVEGSSLGAPNTTNSATSTNFTSGREAGGLYVFDEPVAATPSSSGSGSSGGRSVNSESAPSEEEPPEPVEQSEPVLYGPQNATVGDPIQVSVRFEIVDGIDSDIYAGKNVVFSLPDAAGIGTYQGAGVYSTTFTAAVSGGVLVTATVDGVPVTRDIVGVSDGVLSINIAENEEPEVIDVCEDESRAVSIQSPVENTTVAFTLPAGAARSKVIEQTRPDYRLIVEVKPVSTDRVTNKQQQLIDAVSLVTQSGRQGNLVQQATQDDYILPVTRQNTADDTNVSRAFVSVGSPDCADGLSDTEQESSNGLSNVDSDGDGVPDRTDPDDDNDGTPDDPRNAIIYAHKILCEDESMLPNWGNRGGPNLTRTTAETWVANNPGCDFEAGAYFEWGEQRVRNPGDNRLGVTGQGWNVVGPTNENGLAYTVVTNEQIQNNRHFWFREVLLPNYLTYTYRYDRSSYSAEMYCHTDVLNYDNFDRIDGIKTNESFNCIVWSVFGGGSAPADGIVPEPDSDSDGVPDTLDQNDGLPDDDQDGDGIPDPIDPNPTVVDVDKDGDGLPDIIDTDDDGDGVLDTQDPNPDTPLVTTEPTVPVNPAEEVVIFFQGDEPVEINTDIFSNGVLVPPIEISVLDETGTPVTEFEEAIAVDLFNPEFVTADDILVMQPSGDDGKWFILPAERNDDRLTVTLTNPGEIFIWLLTPQVAEASDGEFNDDVVTGFFAPIQANKAAVDTITSIGLITGIFLGFLQLSGAPFSITHWSRNLGIGLRSLFALITFRRKPKPWGTVYDSETKAPLDPVIVELFDEDNTSVAQAITDLDGRYGFLVPEGMYELKVRKTNYIFPSKKQFLSDTDLLYDNLYQGGMVKINDTVAWDIPMDPVAFDWNQYEKLRTKQTKFFRRVDPILVGLSSALFYIGAILMFWQFFSVQDTTTLLLALLYLVLLLVRIFKGGPTLYGTVLKDGKTLPYALVKIMMDGRVVAQKVADEQGRYVAIVPPGNYKVQVEQRLSETELEIVDTVSVSAKRGYINKTLNF